MHIPWLHLSLTLFAGTILVAVLCNHASASSAGPAKPPSEEMATGPPSEMPAELPAEYRGWTAEAGARRITPDGLYDLIDGSAELYRAFGVRELVLMRYQRQGYSEIEVHVFDMATADNAFGIFHHDLEDAEAGIGEESEYGAGWLKFRKNRWFVYMFALEETPLIREVLLSMGRELAGKLGPPSKPPKLLGLLPASGLDRRKTGYVSDHQILNRLYYLASEDILGLKGRTPAAIGRYGRDGERAMLILVEYDTADIAATRLNSLVNTLLSQAAADKPERLEDGSWLTIAAKGEFLWLVCRASSASMAETLNTAVRTQLDATLEVTVERK